MSSIVPVVMLIVNFGYAGLTGGHINTVSIEENSMQSCHDAGSNLIANTPEHVIFPKYSDRDFPQPLSYSCVPAYKIDNTPTTIEKPLRG